MRKPTIRNLMWIVPVLLLAACTKSTPPGQTATAPADAPAAAQPGAPGPEGQPSAALPPVVSLARVEAARHGW